MPLIFPPFPTPLGRPAHIINVKNSSSSIFNNIFSVTGLAYSDLLIDSADSAVWGINVIQNAQQTHKPHPHLFVDSGIIRRGQLLKKKKRKGQLDDQIFTGWGHFYENNKTSFVLIKLNWQLAGWPKLQVLDFGLNDTRHANHWLSVCEENTKKSAGPPKRYHFLKCCLTVQNIYHFHCFPSSLPSFLEQQISQSPATPNPNPPPPLCPWATPSPSPSQTPASFHPIYLQREFGLAKLALN